ncbi:hypothetical protein TruAng_006762 [Truncatella angustata]|nr:hypothetical protein TruAng_006762 [Truncatella angustata]
MSILDNQLSEVPQLAAFDAALEDALQTARASKPSSSIEPPLTKNDCSKLLSQLPTIFSADPDKDVDAERQRQYQTIESVLRRRFDQLISTTSIESSDFVQVWNILDITILLAESKQSEAVLPLTLIEVLLDSQTLQACRVVFDYLEARRERLIKDFSSAKSLIILRTCNELLRRLSRAEDISFSGRVFIFMFQSFPMGDRGTVNLRGAYHTENVTTWEENYSKSEEQASDSMDVDAKEETSTKPPPVASGKAVSFDARDKSTSQKPLEPDALYSVFWSLQGYFCQPLKLFDGQNMATFKSGLEATLVAFESVAQGQRNSQSSDDTKDASKKRKRFEVDSSNGGTFNPKYLTSRDLFELEMSDLFFRRHILIQAVIVLDFLSSLSAIARKKYANIRQPNKSVMYSDKVISEEDEKWAETMRKRMYDYIFAGPDGAYVHRILMAVTQRDKGWTRWKMETCQPMEKPAVTPAEFNDARESVKRMATSKRLRPHPMGSLNLDFLKAEDEETAMDKFKDPARWKLPDLLTFKNKIAEDDLELDFAKSEKEKAQIIEAKASKTWRALRIAGRTRLAALDRIDDWQDISAVFEEPKASSTEEVKEEEGEVGRVPEDMQPIIISDPEGANKSTLVIMLQERQPHVFQRVVRHTTRQPTGSEIDGQDYHFVDAAAFNRMSDNDQFVEVTNQDGYDIATSTKAIDTIKESGKVPLLEMDRTSIQSCKDWGFSARTIFVSPSSIEHLEARLKDSGKYAEGDIASLLNSAGADLEHSKTDPSFYDTIITYIDLESTYKFLEDFIYGGAEMGANGVNGDDATKDDDVSMTEEQPNGTASPSAEAVAVESAQAEEATN